MIATAYLITPPFTQLNTPYPATAYLKGFLNTRGISAFQSDLGIEVTTQIFSKHGLEKLFATIHAQLPNIVLQDEDVSNIQRILTLQENYIHTIDKVIAFLQGNQPTLAQLICSRNFLPEAARFAQIDDLVWAFGNMGITEKAKHLATLYLEDLSDLIKLCVDEHFGFSRYAEKLGRSANSFDELYEALRRPYTYIDEILLQLLHQNIEKIQPKLVCLSVPFPGNLYAAFRCGQYIHQYFPSYKSSYGWRVCQYRTSIIKR
ncbi:MAG: hypothetical protein V9E96_15750 [Chitinophagaceae bacterium]